MALNWRQVLEQIYNPDTGNIGTDTVIDLGNITIDNTAVIAKLEQIRVLLASIDTNIATIATNTTQPITVVTS